MMQKGSGDPNWLPNAQAKGLWTSESLTPQTMGHKNDHRALLLTQRLGGRVCVWGKGKLKLELLVGADALCLRGV